MSIDKLQKQIRKLKNPSMVAFSLDKSQIPPDILKNAASIPLAYSQYVKGLLSALKQIVPAVRFGFASFALSGSEGLNVLSELLNFAQQEGFYVLLDVPGMMSVQEIGIATEMLFECDNGWAFDGLTISCYLGSDAVKPFSERIIKDDKDLFVVIRTGNKSASELQDLLTGSRLLYIAAADIAKRLGEKYIGQCGYSKIAGIGPATSADSLRILRSKYPELFLLVDGLDYSGANAKNCSFAFDKFGHGAIVCADSSIVTAWREKNYNCNDAITCAINAAERMKKNLTRYITVL